MADTGKRTGASEPLAHALSHDLRAPLRGIANLVDWLAKDYGEGLDDEGRELLRLLDDRVRLADRRSAALADYLRAGEPGPVEPVELAPLLRALWQEAGLAPPLALEIPEPLPVVAFDPLGLRELLAEALDNLARHAGAEACLQVTARQDGDDVEIRLADDGVGIEPAQCERVFDLFRSLAGPDGDRLGMGLARARRIAESHGGHLTAEPSEPRGFTLCLRLPKPPGETS